MPGFVKYAVPSGDAWDITTISTGYFYGPLDIQVGSDGVPQISYHDHDNEDAAYAVLVDGGWQVENIQNAGHDGWDNNLAIDSTGRPHVVSIDPSQFGGTSGVEYATFDVKTGTLKRWAVGRWSMNSAVSLPWIHKIVPTWFGSMAARQI